MIPRRTLSLLAPILLLACSTEVEVPPDGAASGAGGSGGAPTTTSTSGSGGSGGAPAACGGLTGATCGPAEVCVWPDGSCGGDDSEGECQPRPDACDLDCPGVCGCDGNFYCNECIARQEGVDVAASVSCSPPSDYAAHFWPGGLDHLTIFKVEPDHDRCVQLYLLAPHDNAPGFDVSLPQQGWGVSHAVITDNAADCVVPPTSTTGEVVEAISGAGTLAWEVQPGMYAPCTLDVDVSLSFSNAPAWVPPTVTLGAAGVPVEGGCQ